MTEDFVEKILTVTSVNIITELATGELINQVTFGYHVQNAPEILARIPSNIRENFLGKQLALMNCLFCLNQKKFHIKLVQNGS